MPTTRKRRTRGRRLTEADYLLLAVGSGWTERPADEIRELWDRHREEVIARCQRRPFAQLVLEDDC